MGIVVLSFQMLTSKRLTQLRNMMIPTSIPRTPTSAALSKAAKAKMVAESKTASSVPIASHRMRYYHWALDDAGRVHTIFMGVRFMRSLECAQVQRCDPNWSHVAPCARTTNMRRCWRWPHQPEVVKLRFTESKVDQSNSFTSHDLDERNDTYWLRETCSWGNVEKTEFENLWIFSSMSNFRDCFLSLAEKGQNGHFGTGRASGWVTP